MMASIFESGPGNSAIVFSNMARTSLIGGIGISGEDKDGDDGGDDLAAERAIGGGDLMTDDSFLIPIDLTALFFLNRTPVLRGC
jgi:hypothetical protein